MKKLVFLSFATIALLITSCSGGSEENQSGDAVKDEIMTFLGYFDGGLRHSSPIVDVKKFDKAVQDNIVMEKFIGYHSENENGIYEVSKAYSAIYNDKKTLDYYDLTIVAKDEFAYDQNGNEINTIDLAKFVEVLNEKYGKDKHEIFNNENQWNVDGSIIRIQQPIHHASIVLSIHKSR